jgi:hypothetical protein
MSERPSVITVHNRDLAGTVCRHIAVLQYLQEDGNSPAAGS